MSRYSQLYIERGARIGDSQRARRRLAYRLNDLDQALCKRIRQALMSELGVTRTNAITAIETLRKILIESELVDFLDAITIIFNVLNEGRSDVLSRDWCNFARRVFEEENLNYKIDDRCIVNPFVDAEFQANRAAALEALSDQRFGEARTGFEDAFRHLRNGEAKAAIRSLFASVETAARVLLPGAMSRLGPSEVDRKFLPLIRTKYAGNQPAINAAERLLAGMKEWINAAQQYRHGQEVEEPAEPPQEFVVAFLSSGATYLRWMIEFAS
jgi:hypothetical protein